MQNKGYWYCLLQRTNVTKCWFKFVVVVEEGINMNTENALFLLYLILLLLLNKLKDGFFLFSNPLRHAMMSPCSVMLGIIYVNRLKDKNPEYLMQISSADLFLISMVSYHLNASVPKDLMLMNVISAYCSYRMLEEILPVTL